MFLEASIITKKDSIPGDIPVILGGQEPAYYIDRSNHIGEAVVVARSGASAGFVSYWNELSLSQIVLGLKQSKV